MEEFRKLALAAGLIYFLAHGAIGMMRQGQQQTPPAPTQQAENKTEKPPTLKPEDEIAIRKLREKFLGDQVQVDSIREQAQAQIQKYQNEMQGLSKQLGDAEEKAVAAVGADKSKWQWNSQQMAFEPVPAKDEKKAAAKKPQ